MKADTQTYKILKELKSGGKITPLDALEKFGCMRLAPRIGEIKKMGYEIQKEMVNIGNKHFASYSL